MYRPGKVAKLLNGGMGESVLVQIQDEIACTLEAILARGFVLLLENDKI